MNDSNNPYWYGLRYRDLASNQPVAPKASGFYGELQVPNSQNKATEYSADVDINGKRVQIPTIVPGLSGSQLGGLLRSAGDGQYPSQDVMDSAIAHARQRMASGMSPFWAMPEKQVTAPSGLGLLGDTWK
jgi:hypothetical protein